MKMKCRMKHVQGAPRLLAAIVAIVKMVGSVFLLCIFFIRNLDQLLVLKVS